MNDICKHEECVMMVVLWIIVSPPPPYQNLANDFHVVTVILTQLRQTDTNVFVVSRPAVDRRDI
jgi:hypothetical protein